MMQLSGSYHKAHEVCHNPQFGQLSEHCEYVKNNFLDVQIPAGLLQTDKNPQEKNHPQMANSLL